MGMYGRGQNTSDLEEGQWSVSSSGRTGDSRARLLFGHEPSDHDWLFVIMGRIYPFGDYCVNRNFAHFVVLCDLTEGQRSGTPRQQPQ